jgi:hypothetical protein
MERVDHETLEQIRSTIETDSNITKDREDEVKVPRPYFYDTVVKISVYITTLTNDGIENNPNVNEKFATPPLPATGNN